jgi:YesN/AraC family two-component response regulator
MQRITLADISKEFYISQFYFSKIFKEATGFTFVEYLNSVRIKEAQRLLVSTNDKVIRISYNVGFGSIAHFGRMFKAITGYSPLQYRKNMLLNRK